MYGNTVKQIREYVVENNLKVPSSLNKDDSRSYITAILDEDSRGIVRENFRDEVVRFTPKRMPEDVYWKDHLSDNGWAVVPLELWEDRFVDEFFDWMSECHTSFDRDDPTTWKTTHIVPLLHGIIKNYFNPRFAWEVRKACLPVFRELWDDDDLITSFDGGCFLHTKNKNAKESVNMKNLWLHNDSPVEAAKKRHYDRRVGDYVQGVVNFTDSGDDDGGLVLLDQSKLVKSGKFQDFFYDYMKKYPSAGYGFSRTNTGDKMFDRMKLMKICAPKGSILLWDSRMFHCNCPPYGNAFGQDDSPRFRMCTYVTMVPRRWATRKELDKGVKIAEESGMTGHARTGRFFNKNPKEAFTHGKIIPKHEVETHDFDDEELKMIGL